MLNVLDNLRLIIAAAAFGLYLRGSIIYFGGTLSFSAETSMITCALLMNAYLLSKVRL